MARKIVLGASSVKDLRELIEPKHHYRVMAVDAVILKDGKVIMLKRASGLFKGHWVLPGGLVEHEEDTWKAVVREVKEETGLDVRVIRMIGFYDSPKRDPEKHAASMAFLCQPLKGSIKGNEESTKIDFFPPDSLPEKIGFDHRKIIEDAMKGISRGGKAG